MQKLCIACLSRPLADLSFGVMFYANALHTTGADYSQGKVPPGAQIEEVTIQIAYLFCIILTVSHEHRTVI